MTRTISPCLWFDNQAEEAAHFYTSVFKDSTIENISRYTSEGKEFHGQEEGTVMTVGFRINGQPFTALNGGPIFKFNESVSFQVFCDTQDEIDYYWDRLTAGGEEGPCGWLKDKFGLSWQIVPSIMAELMSDPRKAGRVTAAFLQMKKLDIAKLIEAGKE
jgi:predicted 3-demethylubiquinone-9 3-methyltransferase (glyoxalase superfamily)